MLPFAIAVSLVLGQSSDPALDVKVSLTNPGAPAPEVVEQLGKAAHARLFAPKAFWSDILAVRVKDVPLRIVLAKIGDLTAADWEKTSEGYTLTRSTPKLRAEEKAELDAQTQVFQKAIDDAKAKVAKLEKWNEDTAKSVALEIRGIRQPTPNSNGVFVIGQNAWQKMRDLNARSPSGRALTRIEATLDAKELAQLPLDYRIVFSDQPTPMQRALPQAALAALQSIVDEQNVWSDVLQTVLPEGPSSFPISGSTDAFHSAPGKALFAITKTRQMGSVGANVELMISDRKGTVVIRDSDGMGVSREMGASGAPKPAATEPTLAQSPFEQAVTKLRSDRNRFMQRQVPPEVADMLLHPERIEPLSLSAGDSLVKIADAENLDMVADIPDEAMFMGSFPSGWKKTAGSVLGMVGYICNIDRPDGWLIVSPRMPNTERAERVDRAVIGDYVRAVYAKGSATLDESAAYATHSTGPVYQSIGSLIASLLCQTGYADANTLRFYGDLDPDQRRMLATGRGLLFSRLNGAAQEAVEKMVFGPNSNLQFRQQPGRFNVDQANSFYNGISSEATEALPRGIPANSMITMTQSVDRIIIAPPHVIDGGMMMGSQDMSPQGVAQLLYAKERP
ncbi:MAG TPA: hypothetical protein VMI31_07000, partial [Fimbriimonadaceae bacterium]|nr:hypothetical protein [Fimbriimonadaceae bacterium]